MSTWQLFLAVRRVFNSIGLLVPAIVLAFITVLDCDTSGVVAMICICCGFSGFVFSGYNTPNHADISPQYAGSLFGITNMVATIPGFLAPQLVGIITGDEEHQVSAWAPVWYMSVGINFIGGLAYALGASGDEQPWSKGSIPIRDQCKFEIDQALFRKHEFADDLPPLEGEENPVYQDAETPSS